MFEYKCGAKLRIFHFSDIQEGIFGIKPDLREKYSNPEEFKLKYEEILTDLELELKRIHSEKPIDIIVISGDLASGEIPNQDEFLEVQYKNLTEELIPIFKTIFLKGPNKIPKERWIVVPGNHDIHWGNGTERFNEFIQFCKNNGFGDGFKFDNPESIYKSIICFNERTNHRLGILGLNSSLEIYDKETAKNANIPKTYFKKFSQDWDKQFIEIPKILVCHHRLNEISINYNNALNELRNHKVLLALVGDIHIAKEIIDKIEDIGNISAGALFAKKAEREFGIDIIPRQFNIIDIDFETGDVKWEIYSKIDQWKVIRGNQFKLPYAINGNVEKIFNPLDTLKKYKIITDDFEIPIQGRDEITKEIMEEINKGQKFIILSGTGGIGKSSLILELSKQLRLKGFLVGVPNIKSSFNNITRTLEIEAFGGKKWVLFSEFLRGKDVKWTISQNEHINMILDLLYKNICTAFVLECRIEFIEKLDAILSYWQDPINKYSKIISDTRKNIKTLLPLMIDKIISKYYENNSVVINQLEKIVQLSEIRDGLGNPLVAILAADWVSRGKDLIRLNTNEFLENYVESLFFIKKDTQTYKNLEWVSLTRGITKKDLKKLNFKFFSNTTSAIWKQLKDYLVEEDEKVFSIKPDIFIDIIFRSHCFEIWDILLEELSECDDFKEYCLGLSINFIVTFQTSLNKYLSRRNEELKNQLKKDLLNIVNQTQNFITNQKILINPETYIFCLEILLDGQIPIFPENLNIDYLIEGVKDYVMQVEDELVLKKNYSKEQKIQIHLTRIISKFYKNLIDFVYLSESKKNFFKKSIEELIFEKLIHKLGDSFEYRLFIRHTFSKLFNFVFLDSTIEDKNRWFKKIEKKVLDANISNLEREKKDLLTLIKNLYAEIAMNYIVMYDYNKAKGMINEIEEWIINLDNRSKNKLSFNIEYFMIIFYGSIITFLALFFKPDEINEWVNEIENKVMSLEERFIKIKKLDPIIKMNDFYSIIFMNFIYEKEFEQKEIWFNEIEKRLLNSIDHFNELQKIEKKKFFIEIYSRVYGTITKYFYVNEKKNWIIFIEDCIINAKNRHKALENMDYKLYIFNFYKFVIEGLISEEDFSEKNEEWMNFINRRIQNISERLNISLPQIEIFLPSLIIKEEDLYRSYKWSIWLINQPNIFEKIILNKDEYESLITYYCVQTIHRIERHSRNKNEDYNILFSSLETLKNNYFEDFKRIIIGIYEELLTHFELTDVIDNPITLWENRYVDFLRNNQ